MIKYLTSIVLFLIVSIFMVGCMKKIPTHKESIRPPWTNEQLVGSARITASGNINEQRRLAFERAIAELLLLKGYAKGRTVTNVKKSLKQTNSMDKYRTNYKSNTLFSIKYKNRSYNVKIKNIYKDPKTGEIFIRIEEIK